MRRVHDVRNPAVHDGRAGGEQLRDHKAREDLGVLLGQGPGQSAGGGARGHRHRADTHRLSRLGELLDNVESVSR